MPGAAFWVCQELQRRWVFLAQQFIRVYQEWSISLRTCIISLFFLNLIGKAWLTHAYAPGIQYMCAFVSLLVSVCVRYMRSNVCLSCVCWSHEVIPTGVPDGFYSLLKDANGERERVLWATDRLTEPNDLQLELVRQGNRQSLRFPWVHGTLSWSEKVSYG